MNELLRSSHCKTVFRRREVDTKKFRMVRWTKISMRAVIHDKVKLCIEIIIHTYIQIIRFVKIIIITSALNNTV